MCFFHIYIYLIFLPEPTDGIGIVYFQVVHQELYGVAVPAAAETLRYVLPWRNLERPVMSVLVERAEACVFNAALLQVEEGTDHILNPHPIFNEENLVSVNHIYSGLVLDISFFFWLEVHLDVRDNIACSVQAERAAPSGIVRGRDACAARPKFHCTF